ncbi:MAG: class I tRNA ligase family protein [Candidatus Brennerbacteria bacterium]|nr:class I tRNA ligase family protein [Candidatus Brennerbacteria bacterium]
MAKKYDFGEIEKKWQNRWRERGIYEPDLKKAKKPFYNLMMFPYPSAEGLHVGNMYAFVGSDIYGRFKRMQSYDVFEPIGLDGFGIHSENYALKIGAHPMKQAKISQDRFYKQLEEIGNGFAWEEKLETYDPEYYKWTQWIFVQMFKHGLAYRKKAPVNWCPSCKTVLADEQVISGKCERCGTVVVKKELEQWFFRITKYADKLLKNLDKIDWSERVKIAQRNWIGKSEGALIKFDDIEIFTTRPDTIYGATFIVRSGKENRFTGRYVTNPATKEKIPVWEAEYVMADVGTGAIMAVPAHDERDYEFAKKFNLPVRRVIEPKYVGKEEGAPKAGEDFVKRNAVCVVLRNPRNDTYLCNVWKTDHMHGLLTGGADDGEDMVKAALREIREETGYKNVKYVSGPDWVINTFFYHRQKKENRWARFHYLFFELENEEQDPVDPEELAKHEFVWKKREELKDFFSVFEGRFLVTILENPNYVYTGEGYLGNSGKFDGMDSEKAKWEIVKFVGGKRETRYRLRDWLVSRQRYWGPPIPMVYCGPAGAGCGWQPVPEEDLPVELPYVEDFQPKGKGQSPLASDKSFYEAKCPKCGGRARRETDVSDTFLDSAWYYIGYLLLAGNSKFEIRNSKFRALARRWLPVDMYIGGAEHSVLHLLYSRFLAMAFRDVGLLDFDEPFTRFRAHGLLISEGAKMSKSKGNVVNPDEYVKKFGADVLRMYLMFLAPFEQGGDFRDSAVLGIERFLNRIWDYFDDISFFFPGQVKTDSDVSKVIHQTIKKVTEDIESLSYNTAISQLMILLNTLAAPTPGKYKGATEVKLRPISKEDRLIIIKLLAPFTPHLAEELWEKLGNKTSIHKEKWPEYDRKLIEEETFEMVIQINGKVRATVAAGKGLGQKEAETLAKKQDKIKEALAGKNVKKIIYVPDRLINFVA